ncbi:MAG TPA: tetratricopeptide repeat protein, partial [Gemmata sp.]
RAGAERAAADRITAAARQKREELRAGGDRTRTKVYLDWCESELPNLTALAEAAQARGDHATVIGLARALSAFWGARGYWDVAGRLCRWAGAAADAAGDPEAGAWCQEHRGYICRHLGRFAEADAAYRAAVELCDRYPAADVHRARVTSRYGKLCAVRNQYDRAIELLTAALDRARRDGDADGETSATIYLGQAHKFRGDLEEAERLFLRALDRARRAGNSHRECECLYQLGNTYLRTPRLAEAERLLHETLRLSRLGADRVRESQALVSLGIVAHARGAWADAERQLTAGLQLARDLGLRLHEGRTMRRLAELFAAAGAPDRAHEFARGAVAILNESEDDWGKDRARETLRTIEEALATRSATP